MKTVEEFEEVVMPTKWFVGIITGVAVVGGIVGGAVVKVLGFGAKGITAKNCLRQNKI